MARGIILNDSKYESTIGSLQMADHKGGEKLDRVQTFYVHIRAYTCQSRLSPPLPGQYLSSSSIWGISIAEDHIQTKSYLHSRHKEWRPKLIKSKVTVLRLPRYHFLEYGHVLPSLGPTRNMHRDILHISCTYFGIVLSNVFYLEGN